MQDFSASVEAADPTSLVALAAKAEQAQPDDSAPASEDLDPTSLMVLARAGEAGTKPDEDAESPKPTDATARRIREIIGLAHSANKIDRERYGELQPELAALMSGEKTVFTRDDLALVKDTDAPASRVPETSIEYDIEPIAEHITDVDRPLWNSALNDFHRLGLSQAQLDGVLQNYAKASEAMEAAREAAAERAGEQTVGELRKAYGSDYDATVERTNEFIREGLSKYAPSAADRKAIFNLQLADGRRVGDIVPLVRWLSDLAEAR